MSQYIYTLYVPTHDNDGNDRSDMFRTMANGDVWMPFSQNCTSILHIARTTKKHKINNACAHPTL